MKKLKYDAPEFELWAMVPESNIAEVSIPDSPIEEPPTEDSEGWNEEW